VINHSKKKRHKKEREIIKSILSNLGGCISVHVEIPNNRSEKKIEVDGNTIIVNISKENLNSLIDDQENTDFILRKHFK
jgi:hypothetical protein